jgi:hypothetical protein
MKAAVTSYVVCVVRNMEFPEHHFSAKHTIVFSPTVERVNKYKMYCFRRRKNCKEVVRSWSPPGPIKGSVLHNLEYYRRPAG